MTAILPLTTPEPAVPVVPLTTADQIIEPAKAAGIEDKITSPEDVMGLDYVQALCHKRQEHFLVVPLTTRNTLLGDPHLVSVGSANATLAYPTDILCELIIRNAVSFICVHNHPSGDVKPSKEDITCARRIKAAANLLQIEMMDFIIVSHEGDCSLRELRLLEDPLTPTELYSLVYPGGHHGTV